MNAKRLISVFLCVCFLLVLLPTAALASGVSYAYIDENGDVQTTSGSVTLIDSSWTGVYTLAAGWYAVTGSVSTATLTVTGDVHLILADDALLTATAAFGSVSPGIEVGAGNSLTIYGQSTGANVGRLEARSALSTTNGAGIGGDFMQDAGTITINGGKIAANGRDGGGAGIGGGGNGGDGGTVIINGGTVTAYNSAGGAGIGGGQSNGGDGGTVIINGGTVNAAGGSYGGAGIGGGGFGGAGGTVTISGGTVKATGGTSDAEAIGKGEGGAGSGTLQNSGGDNVYLTTITLSGVASETAVTALSTSLGGSAYSYGIDSMKTDVNGILYLYLPQSAVTETAFTAAGRYIGSVTTLTGGSSGTLNESLVTGVTPGGTGAPLSGNIVITFSTAMDTATAGTVSLDGGTTPLPAGSWSNADTVYTVPYSGLSCSTGYNVSISGFEVSAGGAMTPDSTWGFTTGSAPFVDDSIAQPSIMVWASFGTTTATITVSAVINADGTVNLNLTQWLIAQALAKLPEGTDSFALELVVVGGDSAAGVTLSISSGALFAMLAGDISLLRVTTPLGVLSFNAAALQSIGQQAAGDIRITMTEVDASTLSEKARAMVGERPVYDFAMTSGSVKISDFGGGLVTVSLPYTPADGEDPDNIIIYYISDSGEILVVPNCVYDAQTGMVTFATSHFSVYAVGYNEVSFSDVSGWSADYIDFVAARGIMNGIGGGAFDPDGSMTRSMFVTVLYRLSGDDGSYINTFADVASGAWYENAVAWAAEKGIVSGIGNGRFAPDGSITREQLAVMLFNYAKFMGYDVSVGEDTNILSYSDAFDISEYAYPGLQWACGAGILNGDGSGSLNAAGFASRAEAAAVLYRLLTDL